jgi:hypothetical protein
MSGGRKDVAVADFTFPKLLEPVQDLHSGFARLQSEVTALPSVGLLVNRPPFGRLATSGFARTRAKKRDLEQAL